VGILKRLNEVVGSRSVFVKDFLTIGVVICLSGVVVRVLEIIVVNLAAPEFGVPEFGVWLVLIGFVFIAAGVVGFIVERMIERMIEEDTGRREAD